MLHILKFFLNIILFIPRLIIGAIGSFFKLLIISIIIIAIALYYGGHTVTNLFSPKSHQSQQSETMKK